MSRRLDALGVYIECPVGGVRRTSTARSARSERASSDPVAGLLAHRAVDGLADRGRRGRCGGSTPRSCARGSSGGCGGGSGRCGRYDGTGTPSRRDGRVPRARSGRRRRPSRRTGPGAVRACPAPRSATPSRRRPPSRPRPRAPARVVRVDLVEPPVLDVGQVLEQATERDASTAPAAGRAGRRRVPRSSAAGCRGGSRGSRAGSRPRIRRGADRCGSCRPNPIRRLSPRPALRRRLIQIVSASSTNGPNASTRVSTCSTGWSGPRCSERPTVSPCAGSGGPSAARRSP